MNCLAKMCVGNEDWVTGFEKVASVLTDAR